MNANANILEQWANFNNAAWKFMQKSAQSCVEASQEMLSTCVKNCEAVGKMRKAEDFMQLPNMWLEAVNKSMQFGSESMRHFNECCNSAKQQQHHDKHK